MMLSIPIEVSYASPLTAELPVSDWIATELTVESCTITLSYASKRIRMSVRFATFRSSIRTAAAGDRVDLSSLGGRISQAMQSLSNQSAQRTNQLQKDYQAGRYQPDVQQLASALARA